MANRLEQEVGADASRNRRLLRKSSHKPGTVGMADILALLAALAFLAVVFLLTRWLR
jgi:hypothetical protein